MEYENMAYPILNIIHDNRIIGRIEPLIEQCERYGIGYKVWAAIIDKPKVLENITASHKMIVQWAKYNGLKEVCIAEDDLGFTCDDAWRYYLENKPEKFDVYIGGSYVIDNKWDYTPPVVKVDWWVGNQLIIINESYYDKWLSSPDNGHIDTDQKDKGDFYVCFPYVALQRPARSANHEFQEVNYNGILKDFQHFIYK